ncbi:hypothetical protein FQA39_LY11280 [Lamprigera yunnana]|nr:hypothetical protein FQA39_LY11280 [Lamprigera yunnana]
MINIDSVIKNLSLQEKLLKQDCRIRYRSNIIILHDVLQYVILLTRGWNWFENMEYFILFTLIVSTKAQYYTFLSSIGVRFTVFNYFLKKTAQSPLTKNRQKLCETVILVIDQHRRLVNLARTINKIYSFMLLVYISFDVGVLITHSYLLVYVILKGSSLEELTHITYITIPDLFSSAFELYVIASCSAFVCLEANVTKAILHELTVNSKKVISANRIKLISYQLMNDKLNIMAMKLFNVDFGMIYSILATTTNYLLIMLQFDLDSMKRIGGKTENVTKTL